MAIPRWDGAGIAVDDLATTSPRPRHDLAATVALFAEPGVELAGHGPIAGSWADRVVGLDGQEARHRDEADPGRPRRPEPREFHEPAAAHAAPHAGHPPP